MWKTVNSLLHFEHSLRLCIHVSQLKYGWTEKSNQCMRFITIDWCKPWSLKKQIFSQFSFLLLSLRHHWIKKKALNIKASDIFYKYSSRFMLGTLLSSSPENQWDEHIKQGKRQQNLKLCSSALWRNRALEFRALRAHRDHHFWLCPTGRRSHLLAEKHAGMLMVEPMKGFERRIFLGSDFMSTNDHNYMLIPTTTYKTHRWLPLLLFIISQYDCGMNADLKLICARSCPYLF